MTAYRHHHAADYADEIAAVAEVIGVGSVIFDRFRQVFDDVNCYRSLMAAIRDLLLGPDAPSDDPLQNLAELKTEDWSAVASQH